MKFNKFTVIKIYQVKCLISGLLGYSLHKQLILYTFLQFKIFKNSYHLNLNLD